VLVDTSVWIDAAHVPGGRAASRLADLVRRGQAYLCGPVLMELRQGWSEKDLAALRSRFEILPYLECPETAWTRGGQLAAALRRRGHPVPSLDLVIAAIALHHEVGVLTSDPHFDEIAGVSPLRVERLDRGAV
jgi:predicted nucleic acid-binding protein